MFDNALWNQENISIYDFLKQCPLENHLLQKME